MPLQGHHRFGLKDYRGGRDITLITGWNRLVKDNKYIDLRIGNERVIISADEITSLLMLLLPEEKAIRIAPSRITQVKKIPVTLTVPRNALKGEKFTGIVSVEV